VRSPSAGRRRFSHAARARADRLTGGWNADRIARRRAATCCSAARATTTLGGGSGNDRMRGGSDRITGGVGDDELGHGTDFSAGVDVAHVDRRDKVVGCEKVIWPRSAKRPKRARCCT